MKLISWNNLTGVEMETSGIINVEFECVDLPDPIASSCAGLRLGIQEKKQVKQDVAGTTQIAHFMFLLTVTVQPTAIIFGGGFVQGTRDNRFVYLSWGAWDADHPGEWKINSRVKVLLNGISRELIQSALQTHKPIRARIRLTNSKNQPIAASLKREYITWSL